MIAYKNRSFSADEIFSELPLKYLPKMPKKYNRKELAAQIFIECLYEILLDIIDENKNFIVPLSFGKFAEIYLEHITGEKLKMIRQKGGLQKVDLIKSNFSAWVLQFLYKDSYGHLKDVRIFPGNVLSERILDNTYNNIYK